MNIVKKEKRDKTKAYIAKNDENIIFDENISNNDDENTKIYALFEKILNKIFNKR